MISDAAWRARRRRLGMRILLVLYGVCTPVVVALVLDSIPAGLPTVAMASLSLTLMVLVMAPTDEWPSQRPLQQSERRSVLWLMALAGIDGLLFLVVGMAQHHGSWAIGLVGAAAAIGAGAIAVRAFLQH
jgi:hypothetical protein